MTMGLRFNSGPPLAISDRVVVSVEEGLPSIGTNGCKHTRRGYEAVQTSSDTLTQVLAQETHHARIPRGTYTGY